MKKDLEGRQFIAMHDVRGALVTATATLTTGTAASLLVGDTDYFLDPIEVTLSNNSTITAQVSLINDGTTIRSVQVPVGGAIQLRFDAPVEQITKNTPWVIDMEDITGTTVRVDALFLKKQVKR